MFFTIWVYLAYKCLCFPHFVVKFLSNVRLKIRYLPHLLWLSRSSSSSESSEQLDSTIYIAVWKCLCKPCSDWKYMKSGTSSRPKFWRKALLSIDFSFLEGMRANSAENKCIYCVYVTASEYSHHRPSLCIAIAWIFLNHTIQIACCASVIILVQNNLRHEGYFSLNILRSQCECVWQQKASVFFFRYK